MTESKMNVPIKDGFILTVYSIENTESFFSCKSRILSLKPQWLVERCYLFSQMILP